MAGFAEPIHKAALRDRRDSVDEASQARATCLDVVAPEVFPDKRSVRLFWRRRACSIALTCLLQLGLSLAILVLSVLHLTRDHSHTSPVTVLLADEYALTTLRGGWLPWQAVFRLAVATALVGLDLLAIAALLAGLAGRPAPVGPARGARLLFQVLLTLTFVAMTGLFAYFTIFDSYSVAVAPGTSSATAVSGSALPNVTCCSVRLNQTWVAKVLASAGKCYDGVGTGCPANSAAGAAALTSPAQLLNFTCGHVRCDPDDFAAVCVLDGCLFLTCAGGILVIAHWWRRHTACEHCGRLVVQNYLFTPHHCFAQSPDPCVFCGQRLSERDRAAHLRACWEEQARLQQQHESRHVAAAEAKVLSPTAGPTPGVRSPVDLQPILRGGCPPTPPAPAPDAYAVEDQRAYLESQSLLATATAAPPVPVGPPAALPPTPAAAPPRTPPPISRRSSGCQYCGKELGPTPPGEHLRLQCPHYLVPCTHCAHAVPYKDRGGHERHCPLRPLRCRYCDCPLPASEVSHHERHDCEWRTVKCGTCASTVCYRDWHTHITQCQQGPRR
eukprot:EG_transcript_7075